MEKAFTDDKVFWLSTTLQNTIEVSLQLSQANAPEEEPYIHKYKAIEKLKQLLNHDFDCKFIVQCCLGDLYSDVDQVSDSVHSYQNSLVELSKLPLDKVPLFLNYHAVTYNMLGLSYINREQLQKGLGCLAKAVDIYQGFMEAKHPNCYHNRTYEPKGRHFKCFFEGGVDHDQMEDSHTLSLFYLAQAYTKIALKDKAAEYCGMTLQRQYQTSKYEIKEFCHNLIGLAEYYQGSKFFAQGQYILMLALKVLPEGKKKKMRATVQTALAAMTAELLEFSCNRIKNEEIKQEDNKIASRQLLLFETFDQKFPQIVLPTDIQGCKVIFRQANTQIKKALEVFVLDGYVTQHIQLLFLTSKIYKSLSILQKSRERVFNMISKRRELLQPLLKELNPKAFAATWQRILVQVSEIMNDLFVIKTIIVTDVKQGPKEEGLKAMNELGLASIAYYKEIVTVLEEDKDTEKNEQYYRSIVNAKFNVAKSTSKLLSLDRKARVDFLVTALKSYEEVAAYIKQKIDSKLVPKFQRQIQLTNEMIAMLPTKIDRINYGQIDPLE